MRKFLAALTSIMVVIGIVTVGSDINAEKNAVTHEIVESTTARNMENVVEDEDVTSLTEADEEEYFLPTIADENDEAEDSAETTTTVATTKATIRATTKATTKNTTRGTTKSTTKNTTRATTKSTTKNTTRATTKSTTKNTTKATTAAYYWSGTKLNRVNGTVEGPSGRETYYNLPMDGVIKIARNQLGLTGDQWYYWVRDDGVKMYGQYIMCASDLSYHHRGDIVETTLGKAIVLDSGCAYGTIDIAVTW